MVAVIVYKVGQTTQKILFLICYPILLIVRYL